MSKKKLFLDSFWTMGSHMLALVIVLISNIVFARLMSPTEFGQLAIVMFFVSVFNVFTDGGLSGALVRKLERKEDDYSTVFTFNLIVSVLLFIVVIFLSKPISDFYNNPSIQNPIIAASSILIISAFQTVQNVKIIQDLEFKKKSLITFLSTSLGAFTGVFLAVFMKLGLWALISIPITTALFQLSLYIYFKGFYFNISFKKESFKQLFGFGLNTTIVAILNISFNNIYELIIGRIFNINTVGFFHQAKKLQDVPNNVINNLTQGVFYSSLSKDQNDRVQLLQTYKLISNTFLSLVGFAVLIILFFSEDLINFLFGSKWLESAYFIKFLILGSLFYSQELINRIIFKVYNRTKMMLRLEIIKKTVQFSTLLIGIYMRNMEILMYGYILTSAFSYVLSYFYTNKILGIRSSELKNIVNVSILILILFATNYCSSLFGYDRWYLSLALLLVYLIAIQYLRLINFRLIGLLNLLSHKKR